MSYADFEELIRNNADEKYREFSGKLTPNIGKNAGVRTPVLKVFAKKEAKENYKEFFEKCTDELYEEKLVQGLIIGYAKEETEKRLLMLEKFIEKIDNWAVCDMTACAFKFKKGESETVFEFAKKYIEKDGEFEKRFGVVLILSDFIDEKHIDEILKMLNNIYDSRFYVSMAVAWALSVCYVKFEEKAYTAVKNGKLPKETINKTVSKIRQSLRVSKESKERAKELKNI